MRKAIAILITVFIAAALAGCGSGRAVSDLSKVKLEDIEKANEGSKLLEDHDSVSYKMEFHGDDGKVTEEAILLKNGDGYDYHVRMENSGNYRDEVYKDSFLYAEYGGSDSGLSYEVYWFMDGVFDTFMKESVSGFLVNGTEDLEITKREEGDGFVSVTAQVDEGDNVSEEYDFFYEYVMDKESLEINQFVGYTLDKEETRSVQSFAEVSYDKSYKEPSFVKKLEKPSKMRTVTIVIDPGTEGEKTEKLEISAQAAFDVVPKDGYTAYADKEGKKEYTADSDTVSEAGTFNNLIVYMIKE